MKRFLGLVIAAALGLGLSVPAHAAPTCVGCPLPITCPPAPGVVCTVGAEVCTLAHKVCAILPE